MRKAAWRAKWEGMASLTLEQARTLNANQRGKLRASGVMVPHVPIPGNTRSKTGSVRPCVVCGTNVYQYPSRSRKYCSWKCRDIYLRKKRVNEDDGTAKCARCKRWKSITDFVRGHGGRPHSYCKICTSEWFHERRGTPLDKRRPYRPTGLLTAEDKKRNRQESGKVYRKKRADLIRLWNKLRIHRQRAAGKGPDRFDIDRMICDQDARCMYCGVMLYKKYHIDHKTPISRGGTNDLENLQLLCPTCNLRKHTMTDEEFTVSRKRKARRWDYPEPDKTDELHLVAETVRRLT